MRAGYPGAAWSLASLYCLAGGWFTTNNRASGKATGEHIQLSAVGTSTAVAIELTGKGTCSMMKKVVLGVLVSAAARFLITKMRAGQAEQTLWAEATDSVPPSR